MIDNNLYKRYSQAEIDDITKLYPNMPNIDLASKFNRTLYSIEKLARRLKLKKSSFWSSEEINILKKIYSSTHYTDLSKYLNRSIQSINIKASQLKISKDNTIYDEWSVDDINLLKELYVITPYNELENIFNRKATYINMKAKYLGLSKNKNLYKTSSAERLLDDSLDNLYWIGFILADGNITDNYRLKISVAIKDLNHLEKISKILNTPITRFTSNSKFGKFPQCKISVMDAINLKAVKEKFDIAANKTYHPPSFEKYKTFLSKHQLLSLIIGFIDGDGHIAEAKRNCAKFNIRIKMHSSWLDNLIFIKNFIDDFTNITTISCPKIGNHGYASLIISNNKIIHIINNFRITHNLPVLNRKWDKIGKSIKECIIDKQIIVNDISFQSIRSAMKYFNTTRFLLKKNYNIKYIPTP